jgi:hypothetical protein
MPERPESKRNRRDQVIQGPTAAQAEEAERGWGALTVMGLNQTILMKLCSIKVARKTVSTPQGLTVTSTPVAISLCISPGHTLSPFLLVMPL